MEREERDVGLVPALGDGRDGRDVAVANDGSVPAAVPFAEDVDAQAVAPVHERQARRVHARQDEEDEQSVDDPMPGEGHPSRVSHAAAAAGQDWQASTACITY